jgi:bacterioferritin-associated ferredoxin
MTAFDFRLTKGLVKGIFKFVQPMIVCLCHAVSDRTIDRAIRDGAETVEELGEVCGAGTGCGACLEDLAERLEGCSADQRSHCRSSLITLRGSHRAHTADPTESAHQAA